MCLVFRKDYRKERYMNKKTRMKMKRAIRDRGIMQKDIAYKLNVSECTISLFLSGAFASRRLDEAFKSYAKKWGVTLT